MPARKKRNPVSGDFMDAIRDEIESGEAVVVIPPGKIHPMEVELATLRARIAELEAALRDVIAKCSFVASEVGLTEVERNAVRGAESVLSRKEGGR